MEQLRNISFEKLLVIYDKFFSLGYLNTDISDKLACISLTCYITNELRKKGKTINCYDTLLMVCKDYPEDIKNEFLKSLGVMCESLMYGNSVFPDFGIKPKDMPNTIKNILKSYCPF